MRILAVLAVLAPLTAQAISLGDAIPNAKDPLPNVDGKKVSIADAAGPKGTLVYFSCNMCPFVVAWEDRMIALANDAAAKGVGVIAINANDPKIVPGDDFEPMKTRAKEKGYKFPYVHNPSSSVAKAFGATRTPEVYLFDAAGKLVYHGAIDDNSEEPAEVKSTYLKDALTALAAGKPIATKESKPMGCSIKFPKS